MGVYGGNRKRFALSSFVVMVLVLLISVVVHAETVSAKELGTDYLSDVTLHTAGGAGPNAGNELKPGQTISVAGEFLVQYKFDIPNTATIAAGDTISLTLPKEIKIDNTTAPNKLLDEDLVEIGQYEVKNGRDVVITLNAHFVSKNNRQLYFWAKSKFEDQVTAKQYNLVFSQNINVDLTSSPNAAGPIENLVVNKSGKYNFNPDGTMYITWIVTLVWEGKYPIKAGKAVIEDIIPDNQVLLPNSFKRVYQNYNDYLIINPYANNKGFTIDVIKDINSTLQFSYDTTPTADFDTRNWTNKIRVNGTVENYPSKTPIEINRVAVNGASSGGGGSGTFASFDVNKVWKTGGELPSSIKVNIFKNEEFYREVILSESNDWKATITNYPLRDAAGALINYSVKEESIGGYITEITGNQTSGITVTNTAVKSFDITKKWEDENSTHPEITVDVEGTDGSLQQIVLNEGNQFKITLSNLVAYMEDGTEIIYSVAEKTVPNYTTDITGSDLDGFVITNTLIAESETPEPEPEEEPETPKPEDKPETPKSETPSKTVEKSEDPIDNTDKSTSTSDTGSKTTANEPTTSLTKEQLLESSQKLPQTGTSYKEFLVGILLLFSGIAYLIFRRKTVG